MTQLSTEGMDLEALLTEFTELPKMRKANFDRYGFALIDMSDSAESEALRKEWCTDVCIDIRVGCAVVDDSDNVLFTVPPMRPPLAYLHDKHMGDMLDEIHRRQEIHPNKADELLSEHFTSDLYRGAITRVDMENWQYITKLYSRNKGVIDTPAVVEFNDESGDDGW